MARTRQTKTSRDDEYHGTRQALLREAPSTIALLADAEDFAAMRRYAPFTGLDGHAAYLRMMEDLLRTLAAEGAHTTVALFHPGRYELYCAEEDLDPAAPSSRTRYTAHVAATGAVVTYEGQPLERLLPLLLDAEDRRAGLEYATMLLATAGDCANCGEDVGRAAFARATAALLALFEAAGPGTHHLVCSVPDDRTPMTSVLHARCAGDAVLGVPEPDVFHFCSVLAAGIATGAPAGVVLRTTVPDGHDRVRGWSLRDDWLRPLTAGEVFTAYCTDPLTGEPVPPEPGVDHLPGILLPEPGDGC